MSGSTFKCIMIDEINLGISTKYDWAGTSSTAWPAPSSPKNIIMSMMVVACTRETRSALTNREERSSARRSSFGIPSSHSSGCKIAAYAKLYISFETLMDFF